MQRGVRSIWHSNGLQLILNFLLQLILIFLGYGDPSAAQWTKMPDLLEAVDFKDTFVDADHLKESFVDYEVSMPFSDLQKLLFPGMIDVFNREL